MGEKTVNISSLFQRLYKFKILNEEISIHKATNTVHITRIYKVPRFSNRTEIISTFYLYERKTTNCGEFSIHSYVGGWNDPYCNSIRFHIIIHPSD